LSQYKSILNQLGSEQFFSDPYPVYAQLRAYEKPFWLPHRQPTNCAGLYLISRYDDVARFLSADNSISKNIEAVRPPGFQSVFDKHMLHRDGADHRRLRSLAAPYFSRIYTAGLEQIVVRVVTRLLDQIPQGQGDIDFVETIAERVPLAVIADMLGIPDEDLVRIRRWSLVFSEAFDSLLSESLTLASQAQALGEYLSYVEGLLGSATDSTLIADMKLAHKRGELSFEELVAMLGFLLFAGHETTISLIGSVMLSVLKSEAWQGLRCNADLVDVAIEETLRFESPEQRTSFRLTQSEVQLCNYSIEEGAQVSLILGSANRDELHFQQAGRFLLTRSRNPHLAFGRGLHTCLGNNLARMEARVVLRTLLDRYPSVSLLYPASTANWRRNSFFRQLKALPITLC